MEILAFLVGPARFGVDIAAVREVIRAVAVTPLPGAPAAVEGVVNVRGEVMPVFNLRRRLGLETSGLTISDRFVVCRASDRRSVLRVDEVEGVQQVEPDGVEAIERLAGGAEQVAGVARLPEGLLVIYELDRFLSAAEDEALARALDRGGAGEGG